jgi:hypothetical protein
MPRRRSGVLTLVLVLCHLPSQAGAQTRDSEHLPVSGSLVYHALLHGPETAVGVRFAGRLSLEVARETYAGFTVGSWASFTESFELPEGYGISEDLQAVAYLAYVQRYVLTRGFVRAGAGAVYTRSVLPLDFQSVRVLGALRPATTLGAGVEFGLRRYLFVTASADYTHVFRSKGPPDELDRALMLGVALTLR